MDKTATVNSLAARRAVGGIFSLVVLGLVTGLIYALRPVAPVLSLGVLYVFAVLPVAVRVILVSVPYRLD